jgi:RimJ/RimL family protein N-acetyltransferase
VRREPRNTHSSVNIGVWKLTDGNGFASRQPLRAERGETVGRVCVNQIDGIRLSLRLICPADAAYIFTLRSDPRYNTHLSVIAGGVEEQWLWIQRYKEREAAASEYYFVVVRRDNGVRCGLVRIYDICGNDFTWGSWILDENKTAKAALESAILSFSVAFETLKMRRGLLDVRHANTRAVNFYHRLGMSEIHRDECNIYFEYSRERFEADKESHLAVLKQPSIS